MYSKNQPLINVKHTIMQFKYGKLQLKNGKMQSNFFLFQSKLVPNEVKIFMNLHHEAPMIFGTPCLSKLPTVCFRQHVTV